MNTISRFIRTVRGGLRHTEPGMTSFYNAVAQRDYAGGPRYDESRRDYQAMNRIKTAISTY